MVKEVSSKIAFQEAADLLRDIARRAKKREDIDSLLNVTAAWVQIGVHLADIDEEEEEKVQKLGFNIGVEDDE